MTTPLLGPARVSAAQASAWARGRGADLWWCDLTETYWDEAYPVGVRAEVGYAQACKETGFGNFGGVIDETFHNPAGIKTAAGGGNYDPDAHYRFPSWRAGIRDHLHRLWRYATPAETPTPEGWTSVRPVPTAYWGTAPNVESLSGKWAPSLSYHESIVAYLEEMRAMKRGFTIHHNGPPANCVGRSHDRCERFWQAVRDYHVNTKGWSDIAYSFGVCPHGTRFVGRGWFRNQFANGSDNVGSYDGRDSEWFTVLVFLGGDEKPTRDMVGAVRHLIAEGRFTERCGKRVLPHNAFKVKACPGPEFTDLAYRWDNRPLDSSQPTPLPEEDDMHGTDIIASYIEAGYDITRPQIGTDIRAWNHAIYAKPTRQERDGGVAYIRKLLGLPA